MILCVDLFELVAIYVTRSGDCVNDAPTKFYCGPMLQPSTIYLVPTILRYTTLTHFRYTTCMIVHYTSLLCCSYPTLIRHALHYPDY